MKISKSHLKTGGNVIDTSGDKTVDFDDGHSVEMEDGIGDAVTHADNMHDQMHGKEVFQKLRGVFKSLERLG